MAATLQSTASLVNPNPNPRSSIHRTTAMVALSRLPSPCASRLGARPTRSSAIVVAAPPPSIPNPIHGRFLRRRQLVLDRRFPIHVTSAAPREDSMHNDGEGGKGELRIEADESLEALKQTLESVMEEAIKMRGISQEAYDVYHKRAMEVLKETSENMKIQADQARKDLSELVEIIGVEGKEYLSTAAENSPESVKDIVETFASSPDELKNVSEVRDFYLGIPYGGFLVIGGFLHFMLTGSISGIRFGVILGGILLALSVSSLRAWKSGQSSTVFLKGQAAITAILFIREGSLLLKSLSLPSLLTTFISGAMLTFYVYRIMVHGQSKGSLEETPNN